MSKLWTYTISIGLIVILFLTSISPWKFDDIAGILACLIALALLLKELFVDIRNWFNTDEKDENPEMTWLTYGEDKPPKRK